MTTFTQATLTSSDLPEPFTNRLRLGVAAYLARFKGPSRERTCPISSSAGAGVQQAEAERPDIAAGSVRLRRSRNDRY